MALQAIIMAGGEGVRLRPLTCQLPKPLVPMLDEPVMGYALRLLARHGVKEVGATLHYLPRAIREAFGRGGGYGVRLRYFEETTPLGTAGSVRMAQKHLTDTFFVLSGDGLTDCDLTDALRFHRQKGALATLVLKRVRVPLAYGVVMTDEDGRVTRFVEKPAWRQVFSDLVNTGIYILEPEALALIPGEGAYDFGKQLFPRMVREGRAVYGYEMTGYWCDIGDQMAYLGAQEDLLRGRLRVPLPFEKNEQGACVAPDARVAAGAVLEEGCYIGPGARVATGAAIKTGSAVGAQCEVGAGAYLERACLWPRSRVGKNARVTGGVLCAESIVRAGARLSDDTALGEGAVVGAHAQLHPGVKVWPRREVLAEAVVSENVVWGDYRRLHVAGGAARVSSPAEADRLAAAFLCETRAAGVALLRTGEKGEALYHALAGAASARGARIYLLGAGTAPMLPVLQRLLGAGGGMLADGHHVELLDAQGLPLTANAWRAVETHALRQDGPPAFRAEGGVTPVSGAPSLYATWLLREFGGAAAGGKLQFAVFCENGELRTLAAALLGRLGARVRTGAQIEAPLAWETGFALSADGRSVRVLDAQGIPDEDAQTLLAFLAAKRLGAKRLYAPAGAPRAVEKLGETVWQRTGPADGEQLFQHTLLSDGLSRMLALSRVLAQGETLSGLLARLPETCRRTAYLPCADGDKGRVLRALVNENLPREMGEGLHLFHEQGTASILPESERAGVRVVAEAARMEAADELCALYAGRIRRLLRQTPENEAGY